jgi:hypothetical protein
MNELNLRFEFDRGADLDEIAPGLQSRLSQMDMVEEVEAVPVKSRLAGMELVAAIGVTVLIVRGSRELAGEIRQLVKELKGLVVDLKDLKNVYVDVGERRLSLDELDEEQIQQLAMES